MTERLHVYLIEDGERHWYVAVDEEEAFEAFCDPDSGLNGDKKHFDEVAITRLNDDQLLGVFDDDGVRQEKKCVEWCASEGRGFLGSTVY